MSRKRKLDAWIDDLYSDLEAGQAYNRRASNSWAPSAWNWYKRHRPTLQFLYPIASALTTTALQKLYYTIKGADPTQSVSTYVNNNNKRLLEAAQGGTGKRHKLTGAFNSARPISYRKYEIYY